MIWFVLGHRGKAQPCSRLLWSVGEQRLQQCWGQLRGPHLGCELSIPPGTKKAHGHSPFLREEPKYLSNLGGKCCKSERSLQVPRDPTDAAICTSWVFISRRINAGAVSGAARLPKPGSDGSVGGRDEGTPTVGVCGSGSGAGTPRRSSVRGHGWAQPRGIPHHRRVSQGWGPATARLPGEPRALLAAPRLLVKQGGIKSPITQLRSAWSSAQTRSAPSSVCPRSHGRVSDARQEKDIS